MIIGSRPLNVNLAKAGGSIMTQKELEKRVASLEQRLANLEANVKAEPKKGWETTYGCFKGDEVMKRIFENGNKIREADRRKAQRGRAVKHQSS
jgi:hypothetical protein